MRLISLLSAASVFFVGLILLMSAAIPADVSRVLLLQRFVTLQMIELSHLLSSITGLLLLIVAGGLANRLASAWRIATLLLLGGTVFSLIKGVDYEEALFCLVPLALLLLGRKAFYRKASVFEHPPSHWWRKAVLVAIALSAVIAIFAYSNIEYSTSLWWEFAYDSDAPRTLRAALIVAIMAILFILHTAFYEARQPVLRQVAPEDKTIRDIIGSSPRTEAQLALTGDKVIALNQAGNGFVMYGVQGRSLIVYGDPIAATPADVQDLIWHVLELADREHLRPVFYQASIEYLTQYLDAGFRLVKIGEEAIVDLARFSLEGAEGRRLRQAKNRAIRHGLSFAILNARQKIPEFDRLKMISDTWLLHNGPEKGFSMGYWQDEEIRRSEIAVVYLGGKIVAFANLWKAGEAEFSIDLMRYLPSAPDGVMDLMMIELMLHAKALGFRSFNLGLAPLAGLPDHRLAPLWSRIGTVARQQAQSFYSFEGLYRFKNKFRPTWRPRYLASRCSFCLPSVLSDCVGLVSASPGRARAHSNRGGLKPVRFGLGTPL